MAYKAQVRVERWRANLVSLTTESGAVWHFKTWREARAAARDYTRWRAR